MRMLWEMARVKRFFFFTCFIEAFCLISLFNLGWVDELTLPYCISRFIERPSLLFVNTEKFLEVSHHRK